jgi:hypothetical protein
MEYDVIVRDFNPNTEEFKNEVAAFKRGVSFAVNAFRKHELSKKTLDGLEQYDGETDKQYLSRLRSTVVDAMCSNSGYASCFEKITPNQNEPR